MIFGVFLNLIAIVKESQLVIHLIINADYIARCIDGYDSYKEGSNDTTGVCVASGKLMDMDLCVSVLSLSTLPVSTLVCIVNAPTHITSSVPRHVAW